MLTQQNTALGDKISIVYKDTQSSSGCYPDKHSLESGTKSISIS